MIVYFANRKLEILGLASTGLSQGLMITDDVKTEDIDSGVASLELTVSFAGQDPQEMERMCDAGNYLLRSAQDGQEFYTIIDYESDSKEQTIRLYAEDAGLDLLNEIAPPFAADAAHDIAWYVEEFAGDSGFELGLNEVSTLTRKLSWEGEQTVTERLRSVATQFDNCELSYSFAAKGMEITHKYINLYARRGKDMEETLRLNLELDQIVTKKSAANLATALLVTGGTPEGEEDPITLEGYLYDDGDLYIDGSYLKSRSAVEKWGRYCQGGSGGSDRHIVQTYTYDTTSQQTLCTHAVTELKRRAEVEVNYEVDIRVLPENVRIGDRINIVDDRGGLYLSARILKLETSESQNKRTATLGEYLIRDSGISQRVEELASQFAAAQNKPVYTWIAYADNAQGDGISRDPTGKLYLGTAVNQSKREADLSDASVYTWVLVQGEGQDGEDATVLRIDSSRGTVFKNSAVSTVLSVVIYHGSHRITDRAGLTAVFGSGAYLEWSWQRMGEDRFGVISASDSRISNDGFAFNLSPDDVDTKVVFQCNLMI